MPASLTLALESTGGGSYGKKTANAGTAIVRVIPGKRGNVTRITKLSNTAAGTEHNIVVLRSLGRTKTTADAAASQAVIVVAANPGPSGNSLAGSDYVAYRRDDGVTVLDTVSSISGLSVTLTTNLTAALSKGADVWMFGVAADTDPVTNEAHQNFVSPVNVTTTYTEDVVGVAQSNGQDEPLMLYNANATNASTLLLAAWVYTKR